MTTQGTRWTEQDYRDHGYRRLSLRLPGAVLTAISRLAKRRGVSRGEAIAQAVSEALETTAENGLRKKDRKTT